MTVPMTIMPVRVTMALTLLFFLHFLNLKFNILEPLSLDLLSIIVLNHLVHIEYTAWFLPFNIWIDVKIHILFHRLSLLYFLLLFLYFLLHRLFIFLRQKVIDTDLLLENGKPVRWYRMGLFENIELINNVILQELFLYLSGGVFWRWWHTLRRAPIFIETLVNH